MKNKLFLTAFLLAVCMTSQASVINSFNAPSTCIMDEEVQQPTHFILCLKDGRQVGFLLKHSPMVINGDGFITVQCQDDKIEYPLSDIDKYTMGADPVDAKIEDVFNNKSGSFSNAFGRIIMNGFEAGTKITVASINGTLVFSSQIDSQGYGEIDLSSFPKGIYIINVDNQNFKFIKR